MLDEKLRQGLGCASSPSAISCVRTWPAAMLWPQTRDGVRRDGLAGKVAARP
jgi:hypothetical protein